MAELLILLKNMKSIITLFILIVSSLPTFAEITEKRLPAEKSSIPTSDGGKVENRYDITEVFRDGKKVLEKWKTTSTAFSSEGKRQSENSSRTLHVFAGEKKIMLFDTGANFRLLWVASNWPIYFKPFEEDREADPPERAYHVVIPELEWFECLIFKKGELLPLMEGKEFDEWKVQMLEVGKIAIEGAKDPF